MFASELVLLLPNARFRHGLENCDQPGCFGGKAEVRSYRQGDVTFDGNVPINAHSVRCVEHISQNASNETGGRWKILTMLCGYSSLLIVGDRRVQWLRHEAHNIDGERRRSVLSVDLHNGVMVEGHLLFNYVRQ